MCISPTPEIPDKAKPIYWDNPEFNIPDESDVGGMSHEESDTEHSGD